MATPFDGDESTTMVCQKETQLITLTEDIDTIVLSKHGLWCSDDDVDDSEFWGPYEIYWHINVVDNDALEIRTYPPELLETKVTENRELHFILLPQEVPQELPQEEEHRPSSSFTAHDDIDDPPLPFLPSLNSIPVTVHIDVPLGTLYQVIFPRSATHDSCQITVDPALLNNVTQPDADDDDYVEVRPLGVHHDYPYLRIVNGGTSTQVHVDAPTVPVEYVAMGQNTVAEIRAGFGSSFRLEPEGIQQQLVIDSTAGLGIEVGGDGSQVMIRGVWANLALTGRNARVWYQEPDTPVIDATDGANGNLVQAIDIDNDHAFDFVPLPCLIETNDVWQVCPKLEPEYIPGPLAPVIPVFLFLLFLGYIAFVLFRVCPCCCGTLKPPEETEDGSEQGTPNNDGEDNEREIELPQTIP